MSLEERRRLRSNGIRLLLLLRVVVVVVVVVVVLPIIIRSGINNVCNIELFVRKSRRRVDLSSRRRSVSSSDVGGFGGGAILLHFCGERESARARERKF